MNYTWIAVVRNHILFTNVYKLLLLITTLINYSRDNTQMFTNVINCLNNHFMQTLLSKYVNDNMHLQIMCIPFYWNKLNRNTSGGHSNKIPKEGGYTVIRASPAYLHISKKSSGTPNFFLMFVNVFHLSVFSGFLRT